MYSKLLAHPKPEVYLAVPLRCTDTTGLKAAVGINQFIETCSASAQFRLLDTLTEAYQGRHHPGR